MQVVATLRSEFLDPLLADGRWPTCPSALTRCGRCAATRSRRSSRARPGWPVSVWTRSWWRGWSRTPATGDALPLLAFTLAELAEGVERGGRLLTSRYEQLGGVQGALTRQADAALDDAVAIGGRAPEESSTGCCGWSPWTSRAVRPVAGPSRRAPGAGATELDAFVARRLLTTDSENGGVVISVAHEAFLSAWPPLAHAITPGGDGPARAPRDRAGGRRVERQRHPAHRAVGRGELAAAVADTGALSGSAAIGTIRQGQAGPD